MPTSGTYPYFPLFTDEHLASISGLTNEQTGIYFKLILHLWRSPQRRVPNDDAWLAMRLGMTTEAVAAEVRPVIAMLFECDGNWITNFEVTKQANFIRRRGRAQSDRAKSRWNKGKRVCPDDAGPASPGQCPDDAPTPTPTPTYNSVKDGEPAVTPSTPPVSAEAALFKRGREILGKSSGGLIQKLLKHHGGNVAMTWATLEQAADKYDPAEWIGGVLRSGHSPTLPLGWTNVGKGSNWR